jgi:hypothetical protein
VLFSILRQKGAGRRWRERWLTKIDSNWGKHCCCCWFSQKWPSNHIKNDSRILEQLYDCSSSDSERGFGKEKVVCMFCSTLLDTRATLKQSQKAMVTEYPPCFKQFLKGNMSHKCLCTQTLLYVSVRHIFISLTNFMWIPNSMRILYKTSLLTKS